MLAGAATISPLIRPPQPDHRSSAAPGLARPPAVGRGGTGADPLETAAVPPRTGPLLGTSQAR
ncbi:hypothetical protein JQK87_37405 [Streptomyces sp. G44]|uniref:hypothetical protein n=1 Tax=Streptomyces sp. G44 TaxID=2807632 RepID=UPI00195FE596|nr:hypothetical protein [Streptomyces sp. G44]MBM7173940.1 hypothetical protein [Streptomyces sp. G44]